MSDVSYLTPEGLEKIQNELAHLKGPERDAISQRLRSAIQMGDLSENADYIKAKEDQGFLEGRIKELEYTLKNVTIIDKANIDTSKVNIGSTITVQEGDFETETWFLVGPKEASPRAGKISYESPIGKALIGRSVGDNVNVVLPNGNSISLKILKIE
jgi:transcription elongation factor GreA